MCVRQYYYTSYVDKRTGRAGFQVKAMSPGVAPELQTILMRLLAYRIPPALEAHEPVDHPLALRYYRLPSGESILLSSQSCGRDEYGRLGNFFAHALILEQGAFAHIPPICLWKSSLWHSSDPQERAQVVSLPVLGALNEKPLLTIEDVVKFLAQDKHRALLYPLLCAIIHSNKTQRRIVILDSAEHVALWIATVSYLLPPTYRSLLTFATYHHDPYQSHYLITGTTSFRAIAGDALSFFILNVEDGSTSAIEASAYGELVVETMQSVRPTLCLAKVLQLFADYSQRFSQPTIIDEQLDYLALYTKIQSGRYALPLSIEEISVIHNVIYSFEALSTLTRKEVDELERIEQALRGTLISASTLAAQKEYERVLALMSRQMVTIGNHQLPWIVKELPVEEYELVVRHYIPAFFSHEVSYKAHLYVIQTLFARSLDLMVVDEFWRVYLDTLMTMLQDSSSIARAVAMLDFWFSQPSDSFMQGYPLQQLFLQFISYSRQRPLSREKLIVFDRMTAHYPWHAQVRTILAPKQKILQRLGHQIIASITASTTSIKEQNKNKKFCFDGVMSDQAKMRAFDVELNKLFGEEE